MTSEKSYMHVTRPVLVTHLVIYLNVIPHWTEQAASRSIFFI